MFGLAVQAITKQLVGHLIRPVLANGVLWALKTHPTEGFVSAPAAVVAEVAVVLEEDGVLGGHPEEREVPGTRGESSC